MMTSRSKTMARSASGHRRFHARRVVTEDCLSRAMKYLYVSKETEAFNSFLYTFGRRHVKFLRLWFTGGVAFGLFAMVAGVLILAWEAARVTTTVFFKRASSEVSGPLIAAVVPGLNVPFTDVFYMAVSLVLAIGIHEFGHAIAAASEGVPIEHVAVFMAFVFPGALVALKRETLQLLSPFRALRIYCAGVWHNAVCCAGCWFLLLLLPLLLYPFYSHGKGAVVLSVPFGSPVAGLFSPGDVISHINERKILNSDDWLRELNGMHQETHSASRLQSQGFCVPTNDPHASLSMLDRHDKESRDGALKTLSKIGLVVDSNSSSDGRVAERDHASGQKCTEGQLLFYEMNCIKGEEGSQLDASKETSAKCLRAGDIIGYPRCRYLDAEGNCSCAEGEKCLRPKLNDGEALFTVSFSRQKNCQEMPAKSNDVISRAISQPLNKSASCQDHLLVAADPLEMASAVHIVDYRPHSLAPLWLPPILEKLVSYILQYSGGLAVVNSVPVFYLDGEAFLPALMSILTPFMHPSRRRRLQFCVLCAGSMLLLIGVLAGFSDLLV